jgi:hypothetical protein
LVLSIVSFLVCPLIPAIVALFVASSADQEIRASGGQIGGEGLSKAAKIISWINIGLCAAGIVLLVIGLAVASSQSTY